MRFSRMFPAAMLGVTLAGLAACDEAKPRHTPPDPFAGPLAATRISAPRKALSDGLVRRSEPANFTFDHIGQVFDPLNHPPARTGKDDGVLFDGFAFDPVAKRPARGVDVVVDGKAYGANYGQARLDTAAYFKAPVLTDVGFNVTLPPEALTMGPHMASLRVIATDGKSYFQGPQIAFEVR